MTVSVDQESVARGRLRHSLVLTVATYVGAGIGLISQVLLYRTFGFGAELDAYYAAMALPSALSLALNNALRSVVIPALSRLEHSRSEQSRFMMSIILWGIGAAVLVALTMQVLGSFIIRALFPGFPPETAIRATFFFSFLVLVLPVSIGIGTLSSFLLSRKQFLAQALATLVPPVILLAAVVTLIDRVGSDVLIIGNLLGAALQFLVLILIAGWRGGISFNLCLNHPELLTCIRSGIPLLFSNLAARSSLIIEKVVASAIGPGVITLIDLARKVGNIAGQVVTNLNLVSFPELSSHARQQRFHQMGALVRENQRIVLAGFLGLMAGFFSVGDLIAGFLTAGNFSSAMLSIRSVADLVTVYVLVACTGSLAGTLTYWFYARRKTMVAALVVVASLVIMAGTSWFFKETLGAFSLAAGGLLQNIFIISVLLIRVKRDDGVRILDRETAQSFGRITLLFGGTLAFGLIVRDLFLPAVGWGPLVRHGSLPVLMLLCLGAIGSTLPRRDIKWFVERIKFLSP